MKRKRHVSEFRHLLTKGKGKRRKMEIEKLNLQTLKSQAIRNYINANQEIKKIRQ